MKKILSVIMMLSLFLTSCLKDDTINTAGGLQEVPTAIEFTYSGLTYFAQASVLSGGKDTVEIPMVINVAGRSALSSELTVTTAVDDAKRVAYNATSAVKYDALPDSTYSFPDKIGTIPAGQYLDTIMVTFYFNKIDPVKNYMLPISITDAQGQLIASNFSTNWLHTIGNPLAGVYSAQWIRYNTAEQIGTPAFDLDNSPSLFAPLSPTTITVPSGSGPEYIMTFTNDAGVLSDFKVTFDAQSVVDAGITITSGPTVVLADPIAKKFTFNYTYNNSAGAARNITDEYYK